MGSFRWFVHWEAQARRLVIGSPNALRYECKRYMLWCAIVAFRRQ